MFQCCFTELEPVTIKAQVLCGINTCNRWQWVNIGRKQWLLTLHKSKNIIAKIYLHFCLRPANESLIPPPAHSPELITHSHLFDFTNTWRRADDAGWTLLLTSLTLQVCNCFVLIQSFDCECCHTAASGRKAKLLNYLCMLALKICSDKNRV